LKTEADQIAQAVEAVVREGFRTRDLGTGSGAKPVGCKAMGRLVRERLESFDPGA
jgi:isocitrate/isopropylmalate dehydrogenase